MEKQPDERVTVGVAMMRAEREHIRLAAARIGVGVSTYLRMKALEAARASAPEGKE